jgi:1,4-dihydroxy-2-naphthoate polyprenyltransferase
LLAVGIVSLIAGFAYTGGPFPLAYNGLGDVFVLVFFGFVAVCGTTYVQTHSIPSLALFASIPIGLLGVALLAVNNTRDEATDLKANKKTLVVRFGSTFGRYEWITCVAVSFLVPVAIYVSGMTSMLVLFTWLSLPLALAPFRLVRKANGSELNQALAQTARMQSVFALLFAFGIAQ